MVAFRPFRLLGKLLLGKLFSNKRVLGIITSRVRQPIVVRYLSNNL
jgi:hypothetical protein